MNIEKLFSVVLAVLLLPLSVPVEAQQPKKIYRIGWLGGLGSGVGLARFEGARKALRDLGYIEGQNLAIESRDAAGSSQRLPELAAELVRIKVDVIVVSGAFPIVQAAKNATKTIPIVLAGGGMDPVLSGLVDSLARPGGNVTGITNLSRELGVKRLELLKEAVPKLTRVAVLHDPGNPGSVREMKDILPVASRTLGLTIMSWEARDAEGIRKVFATLGKERPGGLYASGPLIASNLNQIVELVLKSRLPSVGGIGFVEAGGLMSYDADQTESYRQIAWYVDRILKGAKPAGLPVQQPTKFELVFNLKTAKQIGLMIPQSLLYRADKVIK